jgi:hypothetical protein
MGHDDMLVVFAKFFDTSLFVPWFMVQVVSSSRKGAENVAVMLWA